MPCFNNFRREFMPVFGCQNWTPYYPIRSFGLMYQATVRDTDRGVGSFTKQQLMREAYPGAVYTYMGNNYRVMNIRETERTVVLGRERGHIWTTPSIRVYAYPQRDTNIYVHKQYGQLDVINIRVLEKTVVDGFEEKVGNGDWVRRKYPIRGIYSRDKYTSNVNTIGVILTHPALQRRDVNSALICTLLYNCFLNRYAFDRADIDHNTGRLGIDMENVKTNSKFITIYDKNSGGLNITSKLLDGDVLKDGFELMLEMAESDKVEDILGHALNAAEVQAIKEILDDLKKNPVGITVVRNSNAEHYAVAKGSRALYSVNGDDTNQEEVVIDEVYYDTAEGACYYDFNRADATNCTDVHEADITPISGVSEQAQVRGRRVINTGRKW